MMGEKLFTKNFTLLILGQASSLFGNMILRFALSMYVLEVTGSATAFASILAISTIPTILLSPLGGILSDRANRRNIMVVLDALTGVSVLTATLLFTQGNALVVIGGLLVVLSVLGAFETPTVQACVPQMQTGDNIVKGNAVVNQIAAVATLIAPLLGSLFYTTFGIRFVLFISIGCFFITAFLECFIKLEQEKTSEHPNILSIIQYDFSISMRFIGKEKPAILKILLLAALVSFFVMGTAIVGFPYIIRNILGLSVAYYGAAQSMMGIAAIVGSVAAGFLTGKLKMHKLSFVLAALGIFLIPAGISFLLPINAITRYTMNVLCFCGIQMMACIFSIFALSYIQQQTPNHLIGKVMAYISTITLCVQPFGQMVYGFLFDKFHHAVYLVLIPTGILACLIGLFSIKFFKKLEMEQKTPTE